MHCKFREWGSSFSELSRVPGVNLCGEWMQQVWAVKWGQYHLSFEADPRIDIKMWEQVWNLCNLTTFSSLQSEVTGHPRPATPTPKAAWDHPPHPLQSSGPWIAHPGKEVGGLKDPGLRGHFEGHSQNRNGNRPVAGAPGLWNPQSPCVLQTSSHYTAHDFSHS